MKHRISDPPFCCIFCGNTCLDEFTSREHIIPESMGNRLLTLKNGWICDKCNNKFSKFEKVVQERTILGVEKCIQGNISKKGKPTKAKTQYIDWAAKPDKPGTVEINITNRGAPFLSHGNNFEIVLPVVDQYCKFICKFLLKAGLELYLLNSKYENKDVNEYTQKGIDYLINERNYYWPYYTIIKTNDKFREKVLSVFYKIPNSKAIVNQAGYDFGLYQLDKEVIFFLKYLSFLGTISLTKPDGRIKDFISDLGIEYVEC